MEKLIIVTRLFFVSALFFQPAALKNKIDTAKIKKQVDEQKIKKAKEEVKKIKKSLEKIVYSNDQKLNKKPDCQVLNLEIEKSWKEIFLPFTTKKFLFSQIEIYTILFFQNLLLFFIFSVFFFSYHFNIDRILLVTWNSSQQIFIFEIFLSFCLLVFYFLSRCNLILHLGKGETSHCFIYFLIFHILHYMCCFRHDTKQLDRITTFLSLTKYEFQTVAKLNFPMFKIGDKGYNTTGILAFVIFFLGTVGEICFFLKAKNRNSFYIFISDFILFILIVYSVFFHEAWLPIRTRMITEEEFAQRRGNLLRVQHNTVIDPSNGLSAINGFYLAEIYLGPE